MAFLGGIGSGELMVLLVLVLIIFGPKQLPEMARNIAKALRGVRNATDELKQEIGLDEILDPRPTRPARYAQKRAEIPAYLKGEKKPPDLPDPYEELGEKDEDAGQQSPAPDAPPNAPSDTPPDAPPDAPANAVEIPASKPEKDDPQ